MATTTLVQPTPALRKGFASVQSGVQTRAMSMQGTVEKTAFLTVLLIAGGVGGWVGTDNGAYWLIWVAMIAGFGVGIVTAFRPQLASKTSQLYALLQGVVLGGISMVMNEAYEGIVLLAVQLTVGILVAVLFIYSTGIIKVTEKFRIGVMAATFGVVLVFLVNAIAMLFGSSLGILNSASPLGIGFSLLVIAIACANLIVDFDFVSQGVKAGYPKEMEWYAAFGIMVTLIWLYLEILRLLGNLRR